MDLVSLCPLPAAQLVWQVSAQRWALTIVCKATYRLEPGIAALAQQQEAIRERESHWEEEPSRSLFAPSDVVPVKGRADVVLVGNAYARHGQPVRALVARLAVGRVDKSIEVLSARSRTRHGDVREGRPWTKTALLYERAAGGPGTDNPVGLGPSTPRDDSGAQRLPNLQPPGFPIDGTQLPPPIGFGPIAASWPSRSRKLPRATPHHDWARAPFGDGFDPAYFQVAPADQQLDALRPNERITLENLHPKHPRLVTRLPGVVPFARVDVERAPTREVPLVADTLWIDTRRAIFTATYRGCIDIEHPEQAGRITVEMISAHENAPPPLDRTASLPAVTVDVFHPETRALPFQPSPHGPAPSPPPPATPAEPLAPWTGPLQVAPPPLLSSPEWGAPPPAPPAFLAPPPEGAFSALEASNAAAGRERDPSEYFQSTTPVDLASPAEPAARPGRIAAPPPVVELLWLSPSIALDRLSLAEPPPPPPQPREAPAPPEDLDSPPAILRKRTLDALTRGLVSTASALDAALDAAEEEVPPAPAVVLVSGTLELCLDEIEMLRATISAASPLASSDKKLKETIDLATDMLAVPMLRMPDFIEGLDAHIRDAWTKANRHLPPDHLSTCTERLLLEQRSYQRRELLGETWIRALLGGAGWDVPIPVYLPSSSVKSLPLYRRFPARVIGEVLWQQDQYEAHPLALRALALARIPPRTRHRARRAGAAAVR